MSTHPQLSSPSSTTPQPAPSPRGSLGRVVVIGGNGFLGHHIVSQAVSSPLWTTHAVISVDLRCRHNRIDGASYHECDITDASKLEALLVSLAPDVVIHTASPTLSGLHINPDALFKKVNVDGTASVIAACQAAAARGSVRALVYTSSASVISDNASDLRNADESWPVIRGALQNEYYSETKAQAEQLVLEANRRRPSSSSSSSSSFVSLTTTDSAAAAAASPPPSRRPPLLTTALRPAGIFGEGDVQNMAGFMRAYRTNKHRVQLGDNTNIFDFTYVGNAAHAHLVAAHALLLTSRASTAPLDHEKVDGEVFFVTNDSPVYFWDFARAVYRAAGNPEGTERVWRLSRSTSLLLGSLSQAAYALVNRPATFTRTRAVLSNMTRYYNITKAKTVLGYQPLWTLQEGIERGVRWFQEQEEREAEKGSLVDATAAVAAKKPLAANG